MNKTGRFVIDLNRLSLYRDEIYGLSIFWIMLFHGHLIEVLYFKNIPALGFLDGIISHGNIGVEVFLFLSGICLYFSYHKNGEPVQFMRKRIARVFPPLLLIYGPFTVFLHSMGKMSILTAIFQLTTLRFWFTPANANWFISLILACYLFYPYIFGILYGKEEGIALRAVILVLAVISCTLLVLAEAPEIYENIEIAITRFPVFIIGCAFGKAVYEKRRLPAWVWLLFAAAISICVFLLWKDLVHSIGKRYIFILGGIPLTFIMSYVLPLTGPVIRRGLRFFGSISLELYIMHLALRNIYMKGYFFTYEKGSVTGWLFVLLISTVLAWIVSKIEAPLVRAIAGKRPAGNNPGGRKLIETDKENA